MAEAMSTNEPRSTVWVVDDSPLDAERVRRALESDHDVEVFTDGSAVLERLASEPGPDVLVLDWIMPGISGIEVCRFLRGANPHAVQLLLLTVQNTTDQIVEGLASGADDFVSKPFHDSELRARVSALVRTRHLILRVRRAEKRLQEVLAASPDITLAFDPNLVVSYVSPGARARFPDLAPGRRLQDALPDLDVDALRVAMVGARVRVPDVISNERTYSPRLGTSTNGHASLVLTDVTEFRAAENRRSSLYTTLAHDLRSPLNSILLRTEVAVHGGRGIVSAELLADLRRIQRMVQDQVGMINDFLELARLDQPGLRIERMPVDLTALLRETAGDLEPLAASRGVALEVQPASGVFGFGDRRRLSQVIANLVGNAIKFTDRGGKVVCRNELCEPMACVIVEDTGRGVDPNVAPMLFARRDSSPDLGSSGSTGFGLSIVRQIVELHGGDVGFDSEPGKGSRFWFSVPRPPQATIESEPEPTLARGG